MIKRRCNEYLLENSAVHYLKAVAIIFMVFHHLFAFDNFIAPSNNWISIIGNRKFEMTVAIFCKVCVGIFAFITGWFASKNNKKYSFNYRLKKIGRLFKKYWIYCIGFIILGFIISEPLPTLVEFTFNLFGLGTRVFDYGGGILMFVMHGMCSSIA